MSGFVDTLPDLLPINSTLMKYYYGKEKRAPLRKCGTEARKT